MAADANNATIAIQVKHGVKTHVNMIGTYSVNQTLSELYQSLNVEGIGGDLELIRVQVAATDAGTWRDVAATERVESLTSFGIRLVCFWLGRQEEEVATEPVHVEKDGLAELMKAAGKMRVPTKKLPCSTKKDELYNGILNLLISHDLGFPAVVSDSEGAFIVRVSCHFSFMF
jgi:hypothetical protein